MGKRGITMQKMPEDNSSGGSPGETTRVVVHASIYVNALVEMDIREDGAVAVRLLETPKIGSGAAVIGGDSNTDTRAEDLGELAYYKLVKWIHDKLKAKVEDKHDVTEINLSPVSPIAKA